MALGELIQSLLRRCTLGLLEQLREWSRLPVPMHGIARKLQYRQFGTVVDGLAIFSHEAFDCFLACAVRVGGFAATEHETGRQPLDVPFPRAGHGFIEVVNIKYQSTGRRGESTKIAHMGITADLNGDARGRERG